MKIHLGLFWFFCAGYVIGMLGPYGNWRPFVFGFLAMAAAQAVAGKLKY